MWGSLPGISRKSGGLSEIIDENRREFVSNPLQKAVLPKNIPVF